MAKLNRFEIVFDDNRLVYMPGDLISGQVVIDLSLEMEIQELRIMFHGNSHVGWSEGGQHKFYHSATRTHFKQEGVLHGQGGSSQDRVTLPCGKHSFPFKFHIPANLPTSYEDKIGYTRYSAKAILDQPWKFNHSTKTAFTILKTLNLNDGRNMLSPSGNSTSRYICCLCCTSGPVEAEIQIDRTGYVPGEWIIVNGTVSNGSNKKVRKTAVELIQTVFHRAELKTGIDDNIVAKIDGEGVDQNKTMNWINRKLQIPALPPTEKNLDNIIQISYSVRITVQLPIYERNLSCKAPIVLGTIPLQELEMYKGTTTTRLKPPPLTVVENNVPSFSAPNVDARPLSPSYADAVCGGFNIKESDDDAYTMGNLTFTPQYIFYNWRASDYLNDDDV